MGSNWHVYIGPYFETLNLKEVNTDDISRDLDESIFCWEIGGKLHWMPNKNRGSRRKFLLDRYDDINYDLEGEVVYDEKDWLEKYFSDEKQELKEKYGDCETKWGIFTFWW